MTPSAKLLKSRLTGCLDKMIAHVEELKERGADTTLDRAMHQQRQMINEASEQELLRFSNGDHIDNYLKRIDQLERQLTEEEPESAHEVEHESDRLDDYLNDAGKEIDHLAAKVKHESEEFAGASALEILDRSLKMSGHDAIVTSQFQKKSITERVAERKARKRWLKTPGGRRYKLKADKLRKRHHIIDRKRSKTAKLNHKVYRY